MACPQVSSPEVGEHVVICHLFEFLYEKTISVLQRHWGVMTNLSKCVVCCFQ